MQCQFDRPLPPNLPLRHGKGGARKESTFKPLALQERGWGEVLKFIIELTLMQVGSALTLQEEE
jgi:hypothetical protein